MSIRPESLRGCLVGMAVGDALGLPYEGLSPRRAARMLGPPDRHRFCFGRGMVSDDTEHACFTAQALMAAGDDAEGFERALASRLRRWLLGCPAGVGLATLRSGLKLCLGAPPSHSGVFSAGNGPAMRSVILGAAIEEDDLLRRMVRLSTRMTHTDPKAETGALAIALAARMAASGEPIASTEAVTTRYEQRFRELCGSASHDELGILIRQTADSARRGESTPAFAASLGLARGVTGYMLHTVPVVLHAWFRHPADYRAAVTDVIACGGDADATAALVGGIVGAAVGMEGIPADWRSGLRDWPRTLAWIGTLGDQLAAARAAHAPVRPPSLSSAGHLARNGLFAAIVLAHGFRRLLPPY